MTQQQLTNSDISQEDSCTPCNQVEQLIDSQQQEIDPECNEKQRTPSNAVNEIRLPAIDNCDTKDSTKLANTQSGPTHNDNLVEKKV